MRYDLKLPARLETAAADARYAEEAGFDGAWSSESTSDPLLLLAAPALETRRIGLGTNILVALGRSPFVVAQAAWELQRASGGRFALGLGTQVRGHLRDRFSVPWRSPAARLAEYVRALRALWTAFQTGEPPAFVGRFYTHTRLTPIFDPGPIDHPHVPVYVAAVNPRNAELAGRLGDGLLVHPMHTTAYLRDVVLPAVARGAAEAGRDPADIEILVPPFLVAAGAAGADQLVRARRDLAFHGATRTYSGVMAHAGFPDLPARLHEAHRERGLEAAMRLVPDACVDEWVVRAEPAEALAAAADRYRGIASRLLVPGRQLAGVPLLPPG